MINVALDASALTACLVETLNIAKGIAPVAKMPGGYGR
jgi:hypothetical protein